MSVVDTIMERFPNLDIVHRNTIHNLADRLGRGHVQTETSKTSRLLGTNKKTWDDTGKYQHTKRVGPYLVGRTLGEGSFAKVKEAMHGVIGEKVAIKIVDKKKIEDDVYLRKNMRREAAILQLLQHRNIVRLFEVMETENNLYMVLELCKGGPLLEKICNEGKLTEDTTRNYVRQMLSAIDHMHKAGVLHRDLKVENILLDDEGCLKLIDFGLSNFLSSISRNGRRHPDLQATQCGSPAYAAPEIIANKRYGPKVDVWSVGVNTFAMLTGTLPFIVEPFNLKILLRKIVTKDMTQMPKHISKDCQDFIKHLLQPDPRARPSVQEVMSHRWLTETTAPPVVQINRVVVDADMVDFIWKEYGIQSSDISNSVICKRADEYSAIYHLLMKRRERAVVGIQDGSQKIDTTTRRASCQVNDSKKSVGRMEMTMGKQPSLHFTATTLALKNDKSIDIQTALTRNTNQVVDIDTQEIRKHQQEVGNDTNNNSVVLKSDEAKPLCNEEKKEDMQHTFQTVSEILPRYCNRQPTPIIPCTTSGGSDDKTQDTKLNAVFKVRSDKVQSFREAFESAKTSSVVRHQLDNRNRDSKTHTHRGSRSSVSGNGPEKIVNCAHKVNLTFRQSSPGSKESFLEHFNYRRRKPGLDPKTKGSRTYRNNIRLNLTPMYTRVKSPRRFKHRKPDMCDTNMHTVISIKQQTSPRDSTQIHLTKLIEDVQLANTPRTVDIDDDPKALTHAQQAAMATFRSACAQTKPVPSEFQKHDCARRVKIAKRKSIDNPFQKIRRKKSMSSRQTKEIDNKPGHTSNRQIRRKLSMEETLQLYRSRNPARSPCICQPPSKSTNEGVGNCNKAEDKTSLVKKRTKTFPEIAPPLVSVSPRSALLVEATPKDQ